MAQSTQFRNGQLPRTPSESLESISSNQISQQIPEADLEMISKKDADTILALAGSFYERFMTREAELKEKTLTLRILSKHDPTTTEPQQNRKLSNAGPS